MLFGICNAPAIDRSFKHRPDVGSPAKKQFKEAVPQVFDLYYDDYSLRTPRDLDDRKLEQASGNVMSCSPATLSSCHCTEQLQDCEEAFWDRFVWTQTHVITTGIRAVACARLTR